MSKIIKRKTKVNETVISLIVDIKKHDKTISCRSLSKLLHSKYNIKLSKSSINKVIKKLTLSSPVGRPISKSFRVSGEVVGAGYVFLLGADRLLGLSAHIAEVLTRINSAFHIRRESLEAACQALIMGKAFYNVPLLKLIDYRKEDMWLILGIKVNKGLLNKLATSLDLLQPVKQQIVNEFSISFRDVHCLKVMLANKRFFYIDGQFKSIWPENNIPIDFSVTYDIAKGYVKDYLLGGSWPVFFDLPSVSKEHDSAALFFASFFCANVEYTVNTIQLIGIKGDVIDSYDVKEWRGKKFLIGVSPSHVDFVNDFSQEAHWQRCVIADIEREFYYAEKEVILPQHILNEEVRLRLIMVKSGLEDTAERGILTNLDIVDTDAILVIKAYIERCPDFKKSVAMYRDAIKNPVYLESFILMEKVFHRVQKLQNSDSLDDIFSILVEVLDLFARRSFFSSSAQGWSFLKAKELFFKQNGYVRRDMADFVVYKLFGNNMLYDLASLKEAILRFNSQPIYDLDGRKVWLEFTP